MSLDPDPNYGRHIIHGMLFIGAYLAEREKDEKRAARMRVALADQLVAYRETFPNADDVADLVSTGVLALIPMDWSASIATTYVIDLMFTRPYAPAEIKVNPRIRDGALSDLVVQIGLDQAALDSIIKTAKSAERVQRGKLDFGRVALIGGAAMLLLAASAGAAAPMLAAAIGSAAGLTGAAALAHGLAVLGFGSLAAGGMGMAGGLWVVTGVGALVGGVGGGVAAKLVQLGASTARTELIKLQTTIVEVTLRYGEKTEATHFVGKLLAERDDVRGLRAEALRRNEDDARSVKQLEDIEEALGHAIRWINDRLADS